MWKLADPVNDRVYDYLKYILQTSLILINVLVCRKAAKSRGHFCFNPAGWSLMPKGPEGRGEGQLGADGNALHMAQGWLMMSCTYVQLATFPVLLVSLLWVQLRFRICSFSASFFYQVKKHKMWLREMLWNTWDCELTGGVDVYKMSRFINRLFKCYWTLWLALKREVLQYRHTNPSYEYNTAAVT